MKIALTLITILSAVGCKSPEQGIKKLGGEEALCLHDTPEFRRFYSCKDAKGRYWICDGDGNCIPADYPEKVFSELSK